MDPTRKQFSFIDAMPGAGKTAYFVDLANSLLRKPNRILLYVAPSLALLHEALTRVRSHKNFDNRYTSRLFLVATPANIKAEGIHRSEVQYFNNAPVKILNYLLDLLPADQMPTVGTVPSRTAQPGDVIFTTHESFLQVYNRDSTGNDFRLLRNTQVVFDEARQCVVAQNPMRGVRNSDFAKIMTAFALGAVESRWDGKERPWQVYQIKSAKPLAYLKTVFHPDSIPRSIRLLHRTVMQYTTSGRASVYLLVQGDLNTFALESNQMHNASVYAILRPTNLFDHYKQVTLTSAFFKDSQLYHFLTKDGHTFKDLMQVSDSPAIDKIRKADKLLRASLPSRLQVGVLLNAKEDDRARSVYRQVLTSSLLSSGMVVPSRFKLALVNKYVSSNLTSADVISKLVNNEPISSNQKFQDALTPYAVPPLWLLLEEADRLINNARATGLLADKDKQALLTINKVGFQQWTPGNISYLKIIESVYRNGEIVQVVNDGYRSLISSEEKHQLASVSKEWQRKLRKLLFNKLQNNFVLPASPKLQGINLYQDLNAFVHLAALNPSPQLIHMYQTLLGNDYDIDQDHSIENLVQMLYRTNLRMAGKKSKVLMIVPYKTNAELLRTKVGCAPFTYINSPALTPWSYRREVEASERLRIGKTAWQASLLVRQKYPQDKATQKKLSSLRVMIHRAKSQLVVNPGNTKAKLRLEELQKRLDELNVK